jgi:Leucine-rich repeat (LRR) protein
MKVILVFLLAAVGSFAVLPGPEDWAASKGGKLVRNRAGAIIEADFRLSWINDADLRALAAFPELTRINLSHTRITDIGFAHLKNLKNVQSVNLYYAEQIGDGALAAMKNWKQLRELNLRGTKVTDAGLLHLSQLTLLESLDIGFALITDGGFEPLTALPGLRSLAVGGNKVTDVGLNSLRLMPALTSLDLSGMQRTDSGLWFASVTDQGLDTIGTLTKLENLNLHGSKIGDAGFEKLSGLVNLRSLDVSQTQLSARGLAVLPKLQRLEKLNLWKAARVKDDVWPLLASLPNLRWIDLTGTGVTPASVAKFRESKPTCRVVMEPQSEQSPAQPAH